MIGSLPTVTFDTSAHNRLAKDGAFSEPMLAGIRSGLFFRFAGLSIGELIACPDLNKRDELFTYCRRLQLGPNDCIYPQNELLRLQIMEHFNKPIAFDWTEVNVRAWEYERMLQTREFITDQQLAVNEKNEQITRAKQYEQMFSGLRPELEKLLAAHGEPPPRTFQRSCC